MHIGIPRERAPGEHRVAIVPPTVAKLIKSGHHVLVESEAGARAYYSDLLYRDAGATLLPDASEVWGQADIIIKVQRPTEAEADQLRPDAVIVALFRPSANDPLVDRLAARGITALSLERVPRTTLAQSMDVLSSQATIAGYQAVLLGSSQLARLLPMLTTAAGTIAPGKAFIIGAGVAGLQAIATARRLGAIVSALDVRPVVKEQVQSLGATFVDVGPAVGAAGEGGYAKELANDQQARLQEVLSNHIKDMDLVITTAQVPGRPAPQLLTADMVRRMRPGSVIVDVAAETGGNCALTRPGETVIEFGVTILGPLNLPSTIPQHASLMFSNNMFSFVSHLLRDGTLHVEPDDPITGPMCLVRPTVGVSA